jgi:hypothetical protein
MLSTFCFLEFKKLQPESHLRATFFPETSLHGSLSGSRTLQINPRHVPHNLQLTFLQEGGPGDGVNLTISIKGDELTLTSPNAKGFEIYRRER